MRWKGLAQGPASQEREERLVLLFLGSTLTMAQGGVLGKWTQRESSASQGASVGLVPEGTEQAGVAGGELGWVCG